MKSLLFSFYRLSFFFILVIAISCQKDVSVDEQSEIVYPVNFQVKSFEESSNLLKAGLSKSDLKASTSANSQGFSEGFLYFWSFNAENTAPDVKYRSAATASITYNAGTVPSSFPVSTYAYNTYVAGKAASISGTKEFIVKMTIKDVQEIIRFGFDIGSTNTGPKDFELAYSVDLGSTYQEISSFNQFSNVSNNAKNSFVYELSSKNIKGEELWLKFVLKSGDRVYNGVSVGDYATTGGTFRLDNVYLMGIAPVSSTNNSINKLSYYLFHQDKTTVVQAGQADLAAKMDLSFDLPLGKYDIVFVSNSSNADLLFPQTAQTSSFYVSNLFSNAQADIFGYAGNLEVKGESSVNVELTRLFSQIKVEFTDPVDLSFVTKIVVRPNDEPLYYAPFAILSTNPVLDQSSITFTDNFNANKQIQFNQFMGVCFAGIPISYTLEVYDAKGIIRSFQLSSTLKNNMQLVFSGELLKDIKRSTGFVVLKNEKWGDQTKSSF